jgi:hypothetical protein
MRHVLLLGLLTTLATVACGGGSSSDGTDGSGAAISSGTTCDPAQTPNQVGDLQNLSSCQLKSLFDSEFAKQTTSDAPLLNGPYDGTPLCRKDILPAGSQLPAGVKAISGASILIDFLHISNHLDNGFAGSLWHGKEFTTPPGAKQGTVLNFIDITTPGIQETTRKSAEAVHFHDDVNQWHVLDYTNAVTGLDGLFEGISVKLIAHVYDTVRLVNPDKQIYLGMAWLVDQPGKFVANDPSAAVESCYFALVPHKN